MTQDSLDVADSKHVAYMLEQTAAFSTQTQKYTFTVLSEFDGVISGRDANNKIVKVIDDIQDLP
jgi:hypothetical protein